MGGFLLHERASRNGNLVVSNADRQLMLADTAGNCGRDGRESHGAAVYVYVAGRDPSLYLD